MTQLPRLLVLVGPTASGKTRLSLALAKQFNAEIISADSRLLYRGLDIGTAKPTLEERAAVPHHLIDLCSPEETISLGEYQDRAFAKIEEIHARGRLPLLVGGTGQYVMSIVEGWGIPRVPPNPKLRQVLLGMNPADLARWLRYLDPERAATLDERNVRRVVRALEVTLISGYPISTLQHKRPPPYRLCMLGLYADRAWLYARIDRRVDSMIESGLLAEVQELWQRGLAVNLPALTSLGYRQLYQFLSGELSFADAVERIKFETHRFARQQRTWFHPDDPRIAWFDATDPELLPTVANYVCAWCGGKLA